MIFQRIAPAAVLRPIVECYWYLRHTPQPGTVERILPDGCAELIFNLRAPFQMLRPDGSRVTQPRALLVGQIRRFLLLESLGEVEVIAARFTPAGAAVFFPFAQDEITDGQATLQSLGPPWNELEERLQLARSHADALQLLERTLLATRRAAPSSRALRAVARLRETHGQLRIEALADELSVTVRQLERDFRPQVGLPPKQFARLMRFQRVFRALDRREPRWADVAADCGYSDQAHLTNEFRTLSGLVPTDYLRHATAMGSALVG